LSEEHNNKHENMHNKVICDSRSLKINLSRIIEEEEIKLKQSLKETQKLKDLNEQLLNYRE